MLLLSHILIALSGLLFTAYGVIRPSQKKIRISAYLLAGTVISGSALVVTLQSGLLRACISGLTLSALMYIGIIAAQRRLITVQTEHN